MRTFILKLKNKVNDFSIRKKLVFSFLIVVFIPIMITGYYLTHQLREFSLNDAMNKSVEDNKRIAKQVNAFLQVPINISSQFLLDNQLEEFANTQYKTTYQYVEAFQQYQRFDQYMDLYDYISNIRFYMDNPTMIDNWRVIQPDESEKKKDWYNQAVSHRGYIGWYFTEDFTKKNNKYLTLVRRIDFLHYNNYGVLVLSLDNSYFNSILDEYTSPSLILNGSDVIASSREGLIQKDITKLPLTSLKSNGTFDTTINNHQYKVVTTSLKPESSYNSMKIVTIIPVEMIVADANKSSMLALLFILLSSIIAILLIYFFSNMLSQRISRLSKHIHEVSDGNLDTNLVLAGNDEIGKIANQFNVMTDNIKKLMIESKDAEREKALLIIRQKEIKFQMLASQINPHFLYNVLESIRMKALLNGEKEISQTVKLLGQLMRKNLEVGSAAVTLKSELEMVKNYLDIQKFRFGSRFSYEMDVDPLSESIKIPPLSVQPLVENAIVHGLKNKETGGFISIRARVINAELWVEVADNGSGITQERLNQIMERMNDVHDSDGKHIGLSNIHQRLQLSYGEEYGLTLKTSETLGTKVCFSIPAGGN
ncbi:sensor histidine kinase [Fictibacillus fluitans]|uniref:Sensor histidine kinase n=1 Tax=Fictibacillus fluitans TaxID=3058422 RepID=A0ABT8HT83_9BACL|nr:sensor histidine kinase [Fictibacillus sp. NE201]MDN4523987.1 sensor histidine kinase [Fictibacillus sp. NE201]